MKNRFVAFDVETPNNANNRISAIGISVIENGIIVDEFYSLVNPDAGFDYFNIVLTGITPEAVADQPNFEQLWPTLKSYMSDGLLIAHNAQFDMSVLSKCLNCYKIEWRPIIEYACTCTIGRRCFPDLPNHKLDTMCNYLHINLNHHNAGSDSRACAELMLRYLNCGFDTGKYIRNYDYRRVHTIKDGRKIFQTR